MANILKIKRGTRAQIDTAGVNQQLIQSEPYLITDEGRMAIGLTSATYAAFAKTTEVQPIDADLTAIAALTGTGILTRVGTDSWSLDTNIYLTGNQTITLSGDATGSGTTSIVVTLKDTGTEGTYTGGVYGSVGLTLDPEATFTPYDSLTKEQVVGWVKDALGEETVAANEANIAKQIEDQISPPIVNPPLPWVSQPTPEV